MSVVNRSLCGRTLDKISEFNLWPLPATFGVGGVVNSSRSRRGRGGGALGSGPAVAASSGGQGGLTGVWRGYEGELWRRWPGLRRPCTATSCLRPLMSSMQSMCCCCYCWDCDLRLASHNNWPVVTNNSVFKIQIGLLEGYFLSAFWTG